MEAEATAPFDPIASELDSPRAWLMAAAAFVACMVAFGVAYSFGAFFKPMAVQLGSGRAGTSAVFAITACIYNLLGVVSGHLNDRYGPRPILLIGAAAIGLGLIATAFIHQLWMGCCHRIADIAIPRSIVRLR